MQVQGNPLAQGLPLTYAIINPSPYRYENATHDYISTKESCKGEGSVKSAILYHHRSLKKVALSKYYTQLEALKFCACQVGPQQLIDSSSWPPAISP